VLSATVTNPVEYCTVQTSPSNVIAQIPVDKSTFDAGGASTELALFAGGIEELMLEPGVIAATGSQTIDVTGLLADNVVFTVQYVPPGSSGTSITGEAVVPVGLMPVVQGSVGGALLADAKAIIAGVYANLKAAAGG
jgi:hypothetical protein